MLILKIEIIEVVILKMIRISVLTGTPWNILFLNLKLKHYWKGRGNTIQSFMYIYHKSLNWSILTKTKIEVINTWNWFILTTTAQITTFFFCNWLFVTEGKEKGKRNTLPSLIASKEGFVSKSLTKYHLTLTQQVWAVPSDNANVCSF